MTIVGYFFFVEFKSMVDLKLGQDLGSEERYIGFWYI